MIHTALNSMHMITQNQSMNAQNLSNLNVPGYRRDLGVEFETAYLETKEGIDAKAFAVAYCVYVAKLLAMWPKNVATKDKDRSNKNKPKASRPSYVPTNPHHFKMFEAFQNIQKVPKRSKTF